MVRRLKAKPFHGNQSIVGILDNGVNNFKKVVNQFCSKKGSYDTILNRGSEATFLSIFSQGLNKKNQYCFLEIPFIMNDKNAKKDDEECKPRHADALLIKRSKKNALTAIIEAKKVQIYLEKNVIDSKMSRIRNKMRLPTLKGWVSSYGFKK